MSYSEKENHSALMIQSALDNQHEVSIFSKSVPYSVEAQVVQVDTASGKVVLQVFSDERDIHNYLTEGMVSFDIETTKGDDEAEILNFEKVKAQVMRKDRNLYELDCQLPRSVFIYESRGGVRVPFILGMQARVAIEVYENEPTLKGTLRNLSIGGCMVDISIEDSAVLTIGQNVTGVRFEFPNGETFFTKGEVRHIRPFGNYWRAAVGVHFNDLDEKSEQYLSYLVTESEREAASRAGIKTLGDGTSKLFAAGDKEKSVLQREKNEREEASKQPPMVRGVREVAHQLQVMLMFMKNRNIFPQDALYDCADTLLFLVGKDRKQLLYALSFLRGEAEWVRHAVQVAASLADFLKFEAPHSNTTREAIAGALLHTMGKPLILSKEIPSLKINMTPYQKDLLKGHVQALAEKLEFLGWQPSNVCKDIILNCNERLDGSGYPAGKTAASLSENVKLLSLIKVINKLTNQRNEAAPRSPIDAYRWVNEHSEQYDKTILVEYIQLYGLYPIGSLAKFSQGFLAWIVDIDTKGMPNTVHVVKNLAFPDMTMNTILTAADFSQIGKLEGIVDPSEYGVVNPKL
ncbi:HD-GYP domain-containing protein (c-di-GMP phosphodiesterase class II) [Modicisalibacter xianhensis]|uniref:HD-GYP domain-containing protein (C-di-GMP phosphodiesterase class II) n=1 Tax=Modicisalibacter xianhensis TaxID=442341 RepID=A0A4V3GSZ6_9GAMM|nr:PilZ domain-containing protein [Halomonas xianhensis]TDX24793.1 HD-GYP domain-containing protein (c-di-GMP phosphodiesterase class II) [Halomonas xianhensis]